MFHLVNGSDWKSCMSFIFNITIRLPLYDGTNTCKNHAPKSPLNYSYAISHTADKCSWHMTYFFLLTKHFRQYLMRINLLGQTQIHADSFRSFEYIHTEYLTNGWVNKFVVVVVVAWSQNSADRLNFWWEITFFVTASDWRLLSSGDKANRIPFICFLNAAFKGLRTADDIVQNFPPISRCVH